MSKKGTRGRWNGGLMRYSERTVEDSRQVRDKSGNFRTKVDECTELDYALRRRSPVGFFRGARIKNRFPHTEN